MAMDQTSRPPPVPTAATSSTLTVDTLAFGGAGVARHDGYVVFVQGAIPGDTVRVEVGKAKRAYAEARVLEVLTPSPERIEPVANHPGAPWQVIPYAKQLEIKAEQVDDSLRRHRQARRLQLRADHPGGAGVALPQQARVLVRQGRATAA